MSQLKITCPNCNETFSADEALQKHLKEKEKIYQEEIKVKEKLLKEKYNLDFKLKEKNLEKELSLKIQEQNKSKFQNLEAKLDDAQEEETNIEMKYQTGDMKQEGETELKHKKKNQYELKK